MTKQRTLGVTRSALPEDRECSRFELIPHTSTLLVFFTSDNGAGYVGGLPYFHSTGPLRWVKGEVYEGGIRAPMVARWPGKIRPGSQRPRMDLWDFLPTATTTPGEKKKS